MDDIPTDGQLEELENGAEGAPEGWEPDED